MMSLSSAVSGSHVPPISLWRVDGHRQRRLGRGSDSARTRLGLGSDSECRPLAATRPSSLLFPLVGMIRGDPPMSRIEVVWLEEHREEEPGRTLPPTWRRLDVASNCRARNDPRNAEGVFLAHPNAEAARCGGHA